MKYNKFYKKMGLCLAMVTLLSGCGVIPADSTNTHQNQEKTETVDLQENKETTLQKVNTSAEKDQENLEENSNLSTGASYEYIGDEMDFSTYGDNDNYLIQYRDCNVPHPYGDVPSEKVLYISLKDDKRKNGELSIRYVEKDNGAASFQWNEVKDAKEYIIFKTTYKADDKEPKEDTIHEILGRTQNTSWTDFADSYNTDFSTYEVSVDEWKNESTKKVWADYYVSDDESYIMEEHFYGVVAMMEDGSFVKSNLLRSQDISPNIPSKVSETEEFGDGYYVQKESELPKTAKVIMGNGLEQEKEILYDLDKAEIKTETFVQNIDLDNNDMSTKQEKVKTIPYRIKGTMFEGVVYIAVE